MHEVIVALHQTALQAEGGISGLAERLGKRHQVLINKLNPNDETHLPTIAEFISIVQDTGDTQVVDVLCALLGGRFVTRSNQQHDSVLAAVLNANSEYGDVARVVQGSLCDGNISESEWQLIMREIAEARDALSILENTIRACQESG
ncbi:MAG: phage regulatory CII family protein [gamma proteobacterium symbiont of Bathyaustriella thionipta]|nr:phage regulatory CII family protein [gamma proteobacterium symbiont of Bathyaustriella thionipta]